LNTLFTRTFLWFLGTVILTFVAMVFAAAIDPEERPRPLAGPMIGLQFSEARFAYEVGGPKALAATLRRFRQATRAQGILTDATGRDLASGEDRSDLLSSLVSRRPFLYKGNAVVGRISPDRRHAFFLVLPRANWFRWLLQPEVHLTMLAALALFSYMFARHLTNPVLRLQKAVDCFGRGELSTRVRSQRKDEIGNLARTFDQMADRIETLLSAERRLLLDISHELRSPLARLGVALELARSGAGDPKHFDRIQKEIERLNSLVGELLQVTRVEGDTARMQFEPLDLNALVSELVGDVHLEAEARGCSLAWSSAEAVNLQGDPELLRRAVENVLRNAVRHAPPQTVVDVKLGRIGNFATISVRDHGPGVPEEHLSRIFDPFFRVETDRNRSSGGVGLGLAIARRAIELHRGDISARNVHPGLLVEIRLPLQTGLPVAPLPSGA
jgi:two-component system sensor histidine kinase CpxA